MQRGASSRLTFERLLCGDAFLRSGFDVSAAQRLAAALRARSPSAPLPVPVASALARGCLRAADVRGAAALLVLHPFPDAVAAALLSPAPLPPAETLSRLAESVQSVAPSAAALFLRAAAAALETGDVSAPTRRVLFEALLRHARAFPSCAGALLPPLCALCAAHSASDRRHVWEALQCARRDAFVPPAAFGAALFLFATGGEHRRVLWLWRWLRHTAARWDQTAASAAIRSAALCRQTRVAIAAIQSLAEANADPLDDAQRDFVRHLAARRPPQTRYADQLVAHWHPNPRSRWVGAGRHTALELLFAHYKAQNFVRLRELLDEAVHAAHGVEERHDLLRLEGMPYILRHFAMDMKEEAWLRTLFECGTKMKDLGEFPLLLGLLAGLARHTHTVEAFLAEISEVQITPENFHKLVTFVVDDICFKKAVDTLEFVTKLAAALSQEVPDDVRSWLHLLGSKSTNI